jgi:hypothetical protein
MVVKLLTGNEFKRYHSFLFTCITNIKIENQPLSRVHVGCLNSSKEGSHGSASLQLQAFLIRPCSSMNMEFVTMTSVSWGSIGKEHTSVNVAALLAWTLPGER